MTPCSMASLSLTLVAVAIFAGVDADDVGFVAAKAFDFETPGNSRAQNYFVTCVQQTESLVKVTVDFRNKEIWSMDMNHHSATELCNSFTDEGCSQGNVKLSYLSPVTGRREPLRYQLRNRVWTQVQARSKRNFYFMMGGQQNPEPYVVTCDQQGESLVKVTVAIGHSEILSMDLPMDQNHHSAADICDKFEDKGCSKDNVKLSFYNTVKCSEDYLHYQLEGEGWIRIHF